MSCLLFILLFRPVPFLSFCFISSVIESIDDDCVWRYSILRRIPEHPFPTKSLQILFFATHFLSSIPHIKTMPNHGVVLFSHPLSFFILGCLTDFNTQKRIFRFVHRQKKDIDENKPTLRNGIHSKWTGSRTRNCVNEISMFVVVLSLNIVTFPFVVDWVRKSVLFEKDTVWYSRK